MANMTVPDCGKSRIAAIAMEASFNPIDGHSTLRLFTNSPTLGAGTVAGSLTELTAGAVPGYAGQALSGATDGGIDGSDRDTWVWPLQKFIANSAPGSPATVQGWFITHNDDGTLLAVQYFDAPFIFTNSGDTCAIIPPLSFGQI